MPSIYLIRHAESTANAGGISLPNADIPLSDKDREQAEMLAQRLSIIPSAVFTSAFLRTQETAAPYLAKLGISASADALLNEFTMLGYSLVKGLNGAQRKPYANKYRRRADLDLRMGDDGETFREFYQRVDNFLQRLTTYPDQAMLFTHGIFIRLVIWRLLGMQVSNQTQLRDFFQFHGFAIPNTAVFQLHWHNNYQDAGIKRLFL